MSSKEAIKKYKKSLRYREYHKEYMKSYHARTRKQSVRKGEHLKCKYGLTLDDYEQMLEEQNGCCAICNTHYTEFTKLLAVDHCHKTGKIRGLLCINCNTALGKFKDSSFILQTALEYLEVHNDNENWS